MCKTVVEDTRDKISVGGLPCNYADEQVCHFVTYEVHHWLRYTTVQCCASHKH
jgi:hypothetical protein